MALTCLPACAQEREAAEREAARLRVILEETKLDNQKKLRERRKEVGGWGGLALQLLLVLLALQPLTAAHASKAGGRSLHKLSAVCPRCMLELGTRWMLTRLSWRRPAGA